MTTKKLFQTEEERAVSPVIGVILMVAITVILAAVIGAFVLGLGDGLGESASPSAQLSLSESDTPQNITIRHTGGDAVDFADFSLLVGGAVTDDDITASDLSNESTELTSGESVDLNVADNGSLEIQLRHDPSNSVVASGTLEVSAPE